MNLKPNDNNVETKSDMICRPFVGKIFKSDDPEISKYINFNKPLPHCFVPFNEVKKIEG